jgi:hypothetical protein
MLNHIGFLNSSFERTPADGLVARLV